MSSNTTQSSTQCNTYSIASVTTDTVMLMNCTDYEMLELPLSLLQQQLLLATSNTHLNRQQSIDELLSIGTRLTVSIQRDSNDDDASMNGNVMNSLLTDIQRKFCPQYL